MTKRVLLVASGGGHWVQLRRLRPAFEGFDVAYASVFDDYADEVGGARFYQIHDATRRDPWRVFVMIPQIARMLLKERPDVVMTTGALPGLVTIALAKVLTRSRTVWLDSIANVERMSGSGMQAKWFADEWLTQWPEVAKETGATHWGAVI